jgi:PAS domain S-box-containing protein
VAPSLRLGLRRLAGRRHPRPAPPTHEDTRLGLLADALFDAVFVHVNGRIAEVNRAFQTTFGYTPDEALELTVFDIIAPENHHLLIEHIQCESEERYEILASRRAGKGATWRRRAGRSRTTAIRPGSSPSMTSRTDGRSRRSPGASREPRTRRSHARRSAKALAVCDAMIAVLMESDGTGHLVSTAVAWADAAPMRVPLDATSSSTARVFVSGEP